MSLGLEIVRSDVYIADFHMLSIQIHYYHTTFVQHKQTDNMVLTVEQKKGVMVGVGYRM